MSRSSIQVSISEETPTCSSTGSRPACSKLVNNDVISRALSMSARRINATLTSLPPPTLIRLEMGSTTATEGLNSEMFLSIFARCVSRPKEAHGLETQQAVLLVRLQVDAQGVHVAHDLAAGFLEGEKEAFLTFVAGLFTNWAAKEVLPVPAVPETSTLLPGNNLDC